MRLTSLFMALFVCWATSFSQTQQIAVNSAPAPEGYDLEVEVVSENIGLLVGALGATDLTGYSCKRVYVTMVNSDDFLSSVSGDSLNPTFVNTTTTFYHAVLGGATPNGINSLLFGVYPDLVYDSWVTIGLEGVPNALAGEADVASVQSTENPWTTVFEPGGGLPGGNIAIDDGVGGAWYALNGDANGVAGDDLRVLAGQFTTDGDLGGQLYIQVFINGDGSDEFRDTFYFGDGAPTPGCTDDTACNYDDTASEDDGSCEYPADLCNGATNVNCDCSCINDADSDGICDEDEIAGCTDETACNYDATATDDNSSCTYPDADNLDCDGNCLNDADGDGVCDEDEIAGCTDETACNYDATATDDNDSCTHPDADNLDCDGNCLNDADGDGICDEDEVEGCADSGACNYDATATDDNGTCEFTSCAGCTSDTACNYDNTATIDDGSCVFADDPCETCNPNGTVNPNDADGDGICDADETSGCTDPEACNAGDFTDTDDSLCEYPDGYPDNIVDCSGACINDTDGDGVCDEEEVLGCTDPLSCTFDNDATDDDGSCQYPVDIYPGPCSGPDGSVLDCDGNCLYDEDGDGICDECELAGCTDPEACNAGDFTDTDNSLCEYPVDVNNGITNLDCDGNCYNDADGDGVCDEDEIPGCTDELANNYDPVATDDDASCTGCTNPIADNYYAGADIDDGTCVISGCTDTEACNYFAEANNEDGSCDYPNDLYGVDYVDCDGNCLNDLDGNGVCNEDEPDPTSDGGPIAVGVADGAPIDSSTTLLVTALGSPSDDLINALVSMGLGDLVGPNASMNDCGSLFLPVDDAWDAAGYNLNTLPVDVLGDLIAGHVFVGLCAEMTEGQVIENYYGELFTYTEQGGNRRLINSDGEELAITHGGYQFGGDSYLYALGSVIALDSADPCLGCASLQMDGDLADYTVECESDLEDAMAASDVAAFACSDLPIDNVYSEKFRFDGRNQVENGGGSSQTWNVLTAGDDPNFNNGEDALLQFYDINGDGSEAIYFVEDLAAGGVTLTQYENGTAILEGAVIDNEDGSRGLDIHLYFDGRTAGNLWGGGFKNDYGCDVNTDDWTIYTLNDNMSYATGRGDWQFGTLLRFNHQPASQYFGYQLGNGANNHNCDANGFSGWFTWSGAIAGEAAYGQAGDVIATLDPTVGYPTDCQDGEFVDFHYVAFDELCNIAQLNIQHVERDDTTAPTYVSGGADITLDCAASDQWLMDNPASAEVVLFSDNCDDSEYGCAAGFDPNTSGFADEDNVFVCVELVGESTASYTASSCRVLNRTWVATDCFGNQAYHTQVITIEDNTMPDVTVTAPADITLNVNGLCFVDLDPSNTGEGTPTYSDNCDLADTGLEYSDLIVDSVSTGCYSIIRTWTAMATDSCGNANADSDNQRIDIQDQIAPSFAYLPVDTIECDLWIDGACDYDYLNSIGLATATDNCELFEVQVECTPLSSACTDDYIIDYTAYDMCGNSTSIQQILVTSDRTAPEFTFAPADLTLECSDASLTGDVDGYAVPVYTPGDGLHAEAMDNCDAEIFVTYEDVIISTVCAQEYLIRRTYSVYDCDENLAQHIQEITIDDSTAPEFTSFPADETVECDAVPAVADLGSLAASDNCDGNLSISYDGEVRTDGTCEDSYTLERSWTTVDCAGNSHTQTQIITVVDTQGPALSIDCPADVMNANVCFADGDLTIATNGEPTWSASDNCDADVEVAYTYADVAVADCAGDDGNPQGSYTVTRTFTVTAVDNCGNETILTCDQQISFTDTEAPTALGSPEELYPAAIPCSEMGDPYDPAFMPITATDNCDDDLTYEISNAYLTSGSCPGTWVREWAVTDDCGNVSAAGTIQYIPTYDIVDPEVAITCPSDATLYLDAECDVDLSTDAIGMATAAYSDDCDTDPALEITFVDSPREYACGESIGSYTFTRTFTAMVTDQCGNTSSDVCEQVITVLDTLAPMLTLDCPAGANLFNVCFADVDTSLEALGEVQWSVSDNCDDIVDVSYVYEDEVEFDCSPFGVDDTPEGSYNFIRTFTVTAVDCNGNTTIESCTQRINTFDLTAPTLEITCPDAATVYLDADCATDVDPSITGSAFATATDDCDSDVTVTYEYTDGSPTYTCGTSGYEFVRTWTATGEDDCGNEDSISCEQLIVVEDTIAPVASITCPVDATVSLDANCEADLTTDALGMATGSGTDNCDLNVTIEVSYVDGAPNYTCTGDDNQLDGSYTFVRTFTATATDDCGNSHSASCDQNITVNDETAPTQLFPNLPTDTLYLDLDCFADLTPAVMPMPEASDNCDSDVAATVTYEDNAASFGALFGEVSVEIETVAEHTAGDLAGMSTYRVYAVLSAEGDFLSSISGEGQFSTQLRSTTGFYQHPLGAATPNTLNPILYGSYPELEYDSYVTIGLDEQPDAGAGEGAINIAGNSWTATFENGGDVVLNGQFGGAWFALNGDSNGNAPADRRVLVAQLTTDGTISGQLFTQVFPQGDGSNAQLFTAPIGDGCEGDDATIEGSYVVSRLWTSTVTDDCGNEDTAYASQYIVVLDTIAPQFTSTCDIENGEAVEYTCADDNGNGVNDIFDFTQIPEACAPSYIENCDSEVALTLEADTMGYVPTGDIANYCMPSTVEAIANGETCDDRAPEAIRLFNFAGGESFVLADGGSSIVEIMEDSTMHIVLETVNEAGDAGFIFEATYEGGHDWNEWLALPGLHNYKKDCAEIFPGLEIWTEWIYYVMADGTMSGTGRFAGSEFTLQHQPLNAYYGLQVGEGANNKNENYGASAWFFWTGEYVLDGASQGGMASSGDIFFDLDCCLGWQIDYDYTVVDDCGNSNGFSYTDLGTGEFGNSANSTVSGHTPVDITAGTSSLKDPIRITGLQPNPTNDISQLGFVVSNNMRLRIDLYTMGGGYVAELFDGNASEDVQYVLDIDATNLSSGMYQIRMSSNDYVTVKKLLVSE